MAQTTTTGSLRIAVDIGGTFTDMACFDETSGKISFGKALSTHGQLVEGIQNTLDGAGVGVQRSARRKTSRQGRSDRQCRGRICFDLLRD